jgi:hypothetical protein
VFKLKRQENKKTERQGDEETERYRYREAEIHKDRGTKRQSEIEILRDIEI